MREETTEEKGERRMEQKEMNEFSTWSNDEICSTR